MKDLKQRQCKNLSIQDIADILDTDVEIAAMILNILDRQGIIETESHVYCHECSADNVISCDGFYEIPVICYKCGKQISITDMEKGGIQRYDIDLKGLEEFVRRDYYEVYYDNSNSEENIIDFECKYKADEVISERKKDNEIDEEQDDEIKKKLDEIECRHKREDVIECIIKLGIWVISFLILTGVCVFVIIDIFGFKDKNLFIYVWLKKAINGSVVEKYESEMIGIIYTLIVAIIGALYRIILKKIKENYKKLVKFIKG